MLLIVIFLKYSEEVVGLDIGGLCSLKDYTRNFLVMSNHKKNMVECGHN